VTEASQHVSKALVLAAGQGLRLNHTKPKPLFPMLGVPLLARTLFTLQQAGITEAYVVVGYRGDEIRAGMEAIEGLTLTINWLWNRQWERSNGVSVLEARAALDGPFVLAMGDHVFDPEIVDLLRDAGPNHDGIVLAADFVPNRVNDEVEATRVLVSDGRIARIGKRLERYNAIDAGVFLASPALFAAVAAACAEGRCALSDGVQRLADDGRARVVDIGDRYWQDVDTKADIPLAERKLLGSVRKTSDGPISRYLNRPISTALSRLLVRTDVTPGQLTFANLLLGLAAGLIAAKGGYWPFLIAGILFQLASVLDGVDGEVAKLTFRASRRGEWLDTLSDNLTYVACLVGLTIGTARASLPDLYPISGIAGLAFAVAGLGTLYSYLWRRGKSGSLLAVDYDFWNQDDLLSRLLRVGQYLMKRDVFAFIVMILAIFGQLPLALPFFAGATFIVFAYSLGRVWLPVRGRLSTGPTARTANLSKSHR
jgi:CDP-L-myo-inositol myo-inositolphosphotransferase